MTEKKLWTSSDVLSLIASDGICPLSYPININGVWLDAAVRTRRAVVGDRIRAACFSRDEYSDKEVPDVITAFLSSTILEFGVLTPVTSENDDSGEPSFIKYSVKNTMTIPVDMLINNCDYVDLVRLQYLLGKS